MGGHPNNTIEVLSIYPDQLIDLSTLDLLSLYRSTALCGSNLLQHPSSILPNYHFTTPLFQC